MLSVALDAVVSFLGRMIKAKRSIGRAIDLRLLPELEALLEIRKVENKN